MKKVTAIKAFIEDADEYLVEKFGIAAADAGKTPAPGRFKLVDTLNNTELDVIDIIDPICGDQDFFGIESDDIVRIPANAPDDPEGAMNDDISTVFISE